MSEQGFFWVRSTSLLKYRVLAGTPLATSGVADSLLLQLRSAIKVLWRNAKKGNSPPGVEIITPDWVPSSMKTAPRELTPALRIFHKPGTDIVLNEALAHGFDLTAFGFGNPTSKRGPLVPLIWPEGSSTPLPSKPQPAVNVVVETNNLKETENSNEVDIGTQINAEIEPKLLKEADPIKDDPDIDDEQDDEPEAQVELTPVPIAAQALPQPLVSTSKRGPMQSPLQTATSRKQKKDTQEMSPEKHSSKSKSKARALSTPKPIKAPSSRSTKPREKVVEPAPAPAPAPAPEPELESEEETKDQDEAEDSDEEDVKEEQEDDDEAEDEPESDDDDEEPPTDTDEEEIEHIRQEASRRRHAKREQRRTETPIELDGEIQSENEDITTLSRRVRYNHNLLRDLVWRTLQNERHQSDLTEVQDALSRKLEKVGDDVKQLSSEVDELARVMTQVVERLNRDREPERTGNSSLNHKSSERRYPDRVPERVNTKSGRR